MPIDEGLSDKRQRGRLSPADVPRKPVEVRLVMTDERRAMYERLTQEIAEWKAGRGPKPRALYLDHRIEKKVNGHEPDGNP